MLLLLLLLLCAPLYGMDAKNRDSKQITQRKDISYIQKTLKRELCSYSYDSDTNLFDYTCNLCKEDPYNAVSAKVIGEHFRDIHNKKVFQCVCNKEYSTLGSITSHIHDHIDCKQTLKYPQQISLQNTSTVATAAQTFFSASSNNNTMSEYAASNASENHDLLLLLSAIATQALDTDPDLAPHNKELSSASAADDAFTEKNYDDYSDCNDSSSDYEEKPAEPHSKKTLKEKIKCSFDGCDKQVTNNPDAIRKHKARYHKTHPTVNIITAQAAAAVAEINNAPTQYSMEEPLISSSKNSASSSAIAAKNLANKFNHDESSSMQTSAISSHDEFRNRSRGKRQHTINAQAAATGINNACPQYSTIAPSETTHNQPSLLDQEQLNEKQLDEEIKIEHKASKRRGRPRKHSLEVTTETCSTLSTAPSAQSQDLIKRKPGRPRKKNSQQEDSQVEHTLDNTEEPHSRKKILHNTCEDKEVWIIRGADIKTLEEDDGEDDENILFFYCSNVATTNQ